jgi:hypothetical protein
MDLEACSWPAEEVGDGQVAIRKWDGWSLSLVTTPRRWSLTFALLHLCLFRLEIEVESYTGDDEQGGGLPCEWLDRISTVRMR